MMNHTQMSARRGGDDLNMNKTQMMSTTGSKMTADQSKDLVKNSNQVSEMLNLMKPVRASRHDHTNVYQNKRMAMTKDELIASDSQISPDSNIKMRMNHTNINILETENSIMTNTNDD